LLERLPKGVRLYCGGQGVHARARAAVTHADGARRNARSALGLEAGELEVATVTSVAFGLLPPAFERWHGLHPATTIALREYTHARALDDAVRIGVGDIAVGPRPPQWQGPWLSWAGRSSSSFCRHRTSWLGAKGGVPLAELAERDWVLFGPDHGLV